MTAGSSPTPAISIVIPAYRQEARIRQDVERIHAVLESIGLPFELIVVVDGMVDGTGRAAESAASRWPGKVRVLAYDRNQGKGYAVRQGMRLAHGDVIGFLDSGGDLDPGGLRAAVAAMRTGSADVVVGSKRHPDSVVHYPRRRRAYSAIYQAITWALFGFSVRDTQAGLKLFRRDLVQRALPYLTVDRYAFDVELLAVARLLGYRHFVETPITVRLAFGSSVGAGSIASMLRDTARVFYRLRIARTYQRGGPGAVQTPDLALSRRRWRAAYAALGSARVALDREEREYDRLYAHETLAALRTHSGELRGARYLEIGCGPAFLATHVARAGGWVVGIDISEDAAGIAAARFHRDGLPGSFVCGDIRQMPFRPAVFDRSYGGGVLEHFADTGTAISELRRVTRPGGSAFNTVPCLSLAALTYRQRWGNIPAAPVLRGLAELIHMKVLGGRHMRYGYELSFRPKHAEGLFRAAGFTQIRSGLFDCHLPLEGLPAPLRPAARWLARHPLFWPMIYVAAS